MVSASRQKPCTICGKPTAEKFTPFCSERCQQRDLGKWLTGQYTVPAPFTSEDEDNLSEDEQE